MSVMGVEIDMDLLRECREAIYDEEARRERWEIEQAIRYGIVSDDMPSDYWIYHEWRPNYYV